MRPIKFRAWDKPDHRYLQNVHWSSCFGYFTRDEDYAVEQYTGENDSNDVEIYEGDIIAVNDHPFGSPFNGNFAVAWNNHDLTWIAGDFRLTTFIPDITVIGNIHENPELLEADK